RRAAAARGLHNPPQRHVPNKPLGFTRAVSAAPSRERGRGGASGFLGSDSHDSYFSNTQRHRVICVVVIFLVSVIIYCSVISNAMFCTGNLVLTTQAGKIANISSTVLKLVPILLLGQVYTSMAEQLTRWVLQLELSTISVAACPRAPLGFALFRNWVEIRLDSHEFVHDYWGPVAESAQGTGIWLLLLETMAHLSVVVNVSKGQRRGGNTRAVWACLPKGLGQALAGRGRSALRRVESVAEPRALHNLQPGYKVFHAGEPHFLILELLAVRLGFIAFEHVVFFLRLIAWLVPDVPAALATKIKRGRFLTKQSLEHNREALLSVSKACGP
ncbi:Anoctamin-7, partial [Pteropus alecto]